ncbi:MAG: cation transporter [Magnetospirillum sp.]|nr:cation transporter [Magnetospirillum sp.]
MFLVEIVAGVAAGSSSLQADALDFFGDAANYGVSLFVLGMSLHRRAMASVLKGATMGAFGLWVIANTGRHLLTGTVPEAAVMGAVGVAALVANVVVAVMLYAFRDGDSNMRSVWICSRNDAIGNLAVLGAASGVFATGSGWPDFAVAGIMAALALSGAVQVLRHALAELRSPYWRRNSVIPCEGCWAAPQDGVIVRPQGSRGRMQVS